MTTLITLDNASFKQTLTGHSGVRGAATVSADLFGGIMVNSAIGSKSQFIASANHMQLTHLRWPGGSLSEDGAFAPVNRLGKTNIFTGKNHHSAGNKFRIFPDRPAKLQETYIQKLTFTLLPLDS